MTMIVSITLKHRGQPENRLEITGPTGYVQKIDEGDTVEVSLYRQAGEHAVGSPMDTRIELREIKEG